MENIPNGPADMTWAWFQTVTDWSVDDVRVEQIGVGIGVSSTLYRAHLQGTGCPGTVIVKLAALDDAAVYTATALGLYRREVLFFAELAAECPVRVPESYFSEINEDGSAFVIVMEDLGENRMVDQVAGIGLADAERAVDHLAEWHATWWNRVEGFSERGLSVPIGSPLYPAVLPGLFAEGWAKLEAEAPHVLEAVVDVGPKFGAAIEPLLQQLDQSPISLLHGDFRADNMLFDANDELMMLDFQITGTGSAVYDLAYFVTQSLDADLASANHRNLFDRWSAKVREHRPDAELDKMWDDYRAAAVFCIIYPVAASRGMDLGDPRQLALVETMMGRMARACTELDLIPLLG